MKRPGLQLLTLAVAALSLAPSVSVRAQEPPPVPDTKESFFTPAAAEPSRFRISGWANTNFRSSQDHKVKSNFPFPFDVYLETPDPGNSFEISDVTLIVDADVVPGVTGHVKVDVVDLYNRNPTSTDSNVDVDEAWVRIGTKYESRQMPDGSSFYALIGKAPKFEKQVVRHLESYGLVSTAFNRMPDLQLQLGGSIGPNLYFRAQVSNGNPLFMRDPNALAGDNGTDIAIDPNHPPSLSIASGFPILYNAEVENLKLTSGTTQYGGGVGVRFGSEDGVSGFDLLGFYYDRKLAQHADLHGTQYGGDLDVLSAGPYQLPFHGNDKKEYGGNVDIRWNGLGVFGQFVHQDIAGLVRRGLEAEVAWRFALPPAMAIEGSQLFTFVQPVVRYSELDNDFTGPKQFPSPSFWWDWKKIDVGIRIGIVRGLDLTLEYSSNDIEAKVPFKLGEALGTLHLAF